MTALSFPVPRAVLALLALGTFILVLVHSLGITGWAYADWPAASAETRQSLTLAGCWVAGCAAWCSGIFSSTRALACPVTGPRRGAGLASRQLVVLCSWAIVSYGVGLLPMVVVTTIRASWGGPDGLVVVGSAAVLVCFVCLGYAAGCLLVASLAVPLAVAAAFAAVVLSGYNGRPSSPVYPFGVVAGLVEAEPVAWFRVLFFTMTALALAAASAWWLQERRESLTVKPVAGVASAAVVIAFGGWVGDRGEPTIVMRDLSRVPSCAAAQATTVCLHPARRALLEPLSSATTRILDRLPPTVTIAEVNDAALWRETAPGVVNLQLQDTTARWLQLAIIDLAYEVSGVTDCRNRFAASIATGEAPEPLIVAEATALWLSRQAGGPPRSPFGTDDQRVEELAEELAARPAGAVERLLANAMGRIRACRANLDDLAS